MPIFKKGAKHPHWKGGRILRNNYWYIHKPDHPFSGKQRYFAEHRLIMEKKIGRYLTKQEVVHHINGNPQDNRIENLILFKTHGEHTKIAHPEVIIKTRIANKGKRRSTATEFKKGFTPWNKGGTHPNKGKKFVEYIECECKNCHKIFEMMPGRLKEKGRGSYCSWSCAKLRFKIPNGINIHTLRTNDGKMEM